MKLDIQIALKLYGEASDLAIDWLATSWGQKGTDKQISLLYYRKACKKRAGLAKRLQELTKSWN